MDDNNINGLEKTMEIIRILKNHIAELERRKNGSNNDILEKKIATLKSLMFSYKTCFVILKDYYKVPLWIKKGKTINVLPICVLITIYELQINQVMPIADIQIPYELIEIWQTSKIVYFLEELTDLKERLLKNLDLEKDRVEKQRRKSKCVQLKEIGKMIKEVNGLKTVIQGDEEFLSYKEDRLYIDKSKTAQNVVPLCKIVVQYLWRNRTIMDSYSTKYSNLGDEQIIIIHTINTIFDFIESNFEL